MSRTAEPGGDELRDGALHEEIELVGQLVVAATATTRRLSTQEIDQVLGVGDTSDATGEGRDETPSATGR